MNKTTISEPDRLGDLLRTSYPESDQINMPLDLSLKIRQLAEKEADQKTHLWHRLLNWLPERRYWCKAHLVPVCAFATVVVAIGISTLWYSYSGFSPQQSPNTTAQNKAFEEIFDYNLQETANLVVEVSDQDPTLATKPDPAKSDLVKAATSETAPDTVH
jgi:hypothetical protein